VKTLFSADPTYSYHEVLAKYRLAGLAAAELFRHEENSVAIEEVLRTQYRDSTLELDRRIFNSIGPYLQELLHTVSGQYTSHPVYYQALVAGLLRLPEVVFVTLNYDVILDRVLLDADPSGESMSWYVKPERNWSLVKVHGSVNWSRTLGLNSATAFFNPPANVPLDGPISYGRLDRELWELRGFNGPQGGFSHGSLRYPVLSVPQGTEDEVACPDEHIAFLRHKLAVSTNLDLCFLGYSAHDAEVMRLIRDSGKPVRHLTVVDRDQETAEAILDRLRAEHGIAGQGAEAFRGDLGHWIYAGGFDRAVEFWERLP
jgi:hypothetical protein